MKSTMRVLLSTGNKTEIKFAVNGIYSIRNGSALPEGTYYIQNSGGNLILMNEARQQIPTPAGNPIKIEENQNPVPDANKITVYQVEGKQYPRVFRQYEILDRPPVCRRCKSCLY